MEKFNMLMFLTPRNEIKVLDDTMTIRQGLEKMKIHGYTCIPLISKKTGEYLGSINEGDLLWNIVDKDDINFYDLSKYNLKDILRSNFCPPVKYDSSFEQLLEAITNQNYVPIVDDRNVLMGIITRKKVISELAKHLEKK